MNMNLIGKLFNLFCRIVTIIFVISAAYISVLFGFSVNLRLTYVLGILGISVVMTLAAIPFFVDCNMSKVKMFVCQTAYFVFVNALVLVAGYFFDWFCMDRISTLIALELCVVAVYVILMVISYSSEKKTAEKMIEKIRERKGE